MYKIHYTAKWNEEGENPKTGFVTSDIKGKKIQTFNGRVEAALYAKYLNKRDPMHRHKVVVG